MAFLWNPIDNYIITLQHEFFGHGYRIRDFGKNVASAKKYKIFVPHPYGPGGGYTSYEYKSFTSFHETAIAIAGTEATSIFAKDIKMNWLKKEIINPLQSILYINTIHDLTNYIFSTHQHSIRENSSNDIARFIVNIENSYPSSHLSLSSLKKHAFINFLDPFTFLAIYSYYKYLFTGKTQTLPMIHIKNHRYLPSLRLGLSPFGSETYLENFLCNDKGPMNFYFKFGKYWKNKYFGAGILSPYLFVKDNFCCGLKLDIWHQPLFLECNKACKSMEHREGTLFYDFREEDLTKKRIGASFTLITRCKIKKTPLYFDGSLGYKTKGFVPGETLKQVPIVRVGIFGSF